MIAFHLTFASPASATTKCDLVAATNGVDSNPGTIEQPFRTPQKLVSALAPDTTGCLRGGLYDAEAGVKLAVPGITLTSYPGERATLRGRLWVSDAAPGSTVSDLNLDGRNDRGLPSPTINGDDVTLSGNDITNHNTTICISVGSPDTWGRAQDTLIEANRIHDCGARPANNYDHGIYVNSADGTIIRGNWIYDNANRGIQLYPDAQGSLVSGNVIDGNGEGVIFGGGDKAASSGNVLEYNVITNSKLRDNIESSWGTKVGSNNVARDNCVGGGAYDDGDGGILAGAGRGFTTARNALGVPAFADRSAKDFSIDPESHCGQLLAQGTSATPPPVMEPPASEPVITIDMSHKRVKAAKPVQVRGRATGASRVRIEIRRDGKWHWIGSDSTSGAGRYRTRVRIHRPGRGRIKAVAKGLRDSRPVRVKVERRNHRHH